MSNTSVAETTTRLRALEERYRHEIMGEEQRLELRERILRLRKKVEAKAGRA